MNDDTVKPPKPVIGVAGAWEEVADLWIRVAMAGGNPAPMTILVQPTFGELGLWEWMGPGGRRTGFPSPHHARKACDEAHRAAGWLFTDEADGTTRLSAWAVERWLNDSRRRERQDKERRTTDRNGLRKLCSHAWENGRSAKVAIGSGMSVCEACDEQFD